MSFALSDRFTKSSKLANLCLGTAIVTSALAAFAIRSFCATYFVPDTRATIQAAIDSAASLDTILVRPGTYSENLKTLGKPITLKSTDGPEVTTIDGRWLGSVITVTSDLRLIGFTIQNGINDYGGGIRVTGGRVALSIRENIIRSNRAGYYVDSGNGGGIYIDSPYAESIIEGNTIDQNYAGDSGGGLALSGIVLLKANTISNNGCHVGGGGVESSGRVRITGNLIIKNWSDSFGGGICGGAESIVGNTVVSNYINNPVFPQATGIGTSGTLIEGNIVALNHGPMGRGTGIGIQCGSGTVMRCNDVWGNDIDLDLFSGCDTTETHNISEDPMFCDPNASDFELKGLSPCAPANSQACGLIGAYSVGCDAVFTQKATWGRLKALYR